MAALFLLLATYPPEAWAAHATWLFYGSSLLFGLVHLWNWEITVTEAWRVAAFIPLVLPQLAAGRNAASTGTPMPGAASHGTTALLAFGA